MFTTAFAIAMSLMVQDPPAVAVEGIVVDGRPVGEAARDFVTAVAAPADGRGVAQWRDELCLGVANIQADAAQSLIDRVSDIAAELNVPLGEPGCEANALVIFTDNGAGLARQLIEDDEYEFSLAASGVAEDRRALARFRDGDAAVRWWQVSVPVDSQTGQRIARRGDQGPAAINTFAPSRIGSQIRDDMTKSVVIIDVDGVSDVSFAQLADYVAMVTLAQINPEGAPAGFPTILNVFRDSGAATSLSAWDWAYLRALYISREQRLTPGTLASDVAGVMSRGSRPLS